MTRSIGPGFCGCPALGIPTVLSDIPTYREISADFQHAFLFPAEDHQALADTIIAAQRVDRDVIEREAVRFRRRYDLRRIANSISMQCDSIVGNNIFA